MFKVVDVVVEVVDIYHFYRDLTLFCSKMAQKMPLSPCALLPSLLLPSFLLSNVPAPMEHRSNGRGTNCRAASGICGDNGALSSKTSDFGSKIIKKVVEVVDLYHFYHYIHHFQCIITQLFTRKVVEVVINSPKIFMALV